MNRYLGLIFLLAFLLLGYVLETAPATADAPLALATPTPMPRNGAVKPTPQSPQNSPPTWRNSIAITSNANGEPVASMVSSDLPPTSSITFTVGTVKSPGLALSKEKTFAQFKPTTPITAGDFVDSWQLLVQDNFTGTFPITTSCLITEGNAYPPQGRLWGKDTQHPKGDGISIWPARGGPNGLDPATNNYPPSLDSWLVCGPYDFTNAQHLQIDYQVFVDIPDADDFVGVVYSIVGNSWDGVVWSGTAPQQQWITATVSTSSFGGVPLEGQPQVWVAVVFRSDPDTFTGHGAWIDDLKIWRYNNPAVTCANLDPPGNKGVNISAYDIVSNTIYPAIRSGEVQVVQGLMAADADWVRLPILQNNGVFIDDQAYDRMIDTLCNAGISVMPLFNHESITRSRDDANSTDPAIAASYRIDFANRAKWLAGHFKGRVKYWQVWNEPERAFPLTDSHYAALLTQTASQIKTAEADPNAKIVAAGLDHAWNAQDDYLRDVYVRLDNEQGHARPFDVFAVHPYNDNQQYSMNPVGYMHAITEMNIALGDKTIIDKFVRRMEANQDTGKIVWISEVGWNSSLGAQNAPWFAVSETTQAFYLQRGLDILFNEARSVDKVFWYKYMDENISTTLQSLIRIQNGEEWRLRHPDLQVFAPSSPSVIVPGWWGLYRTTKLDAKPSRCAFSYYPQRCPDLPPPVFLPLLLNGQ